MSRRVPYNLQVARILRVYCQSLTMTFFVGFGLGGCSDGGEQMEEPVQSQDGSELDESNMDDSMSFETTDAAMDPSGEEGHTAEQNAAADEDDEVEAMIPDEGLEEPAPEYGESTLAPADQSPLPGSVAEGDGEYTAEAPLFEEPTALTPPPVFDEPMVEEPAATASVKGSPVMPERTQPSFGHSVQAAATKGPTGVYVVQAGDSLAYIAHKIYGNPGQWPRLAAVNGIAAPYLIFPGDGLTFEVSTAKARTFADALNSIAKQSVTVRRGDTLSGIAQRIYGDASAWKQLVALNRKKIHNPHRIAAGMVLSYLDPQELAQVIHGKVSGHGTAAKSSKVEAEPAVSDGGENSTEQAFEEAETETQTDDTDSDVAGETATADASNSNPETATEDDSTTTPNDEAAFEEEAIFENASTTESAVTTEDSANPEFEDDVEPASEE